LNDDASQRSSDTLGDDRRQASALVRRIRLAMPDAWVYMLRCADGSLYTGWSTDVQRRLARHRAGKASRYTASRLPVELAFVTPMADRPAARREEARIKALDRAAKLALITAAEETSPAAAGRAV
jgi:putative endonuclease